MPLSSGASSVGHVLTDLYQARARLSSCLSCMAPAGIISDDNHPLGGGASTCTVRMHPSLEGLDRPGARSSVEDEGVEPREAQATIV